MSRESQIGPPDPHVADPEVGCELHGPAGPAKAYTVHDKHAVQRRVRRETHASYIYTPELPCHGKP
jgi:hypothetical protein